MSKILITGSNGVIGSYLAKLFVSKGHEIIGIDNFSNSYRETFDFSHKLYELDLEDTLNYHKIRDLCEGVDYVFHCACLAYEGFSNAAPNFVSKSVLNPTITVATAAADAGVKRLFNFSSMARYGRSLVLPFREDLTPEAADPYGAAKISAEIMLNTMSDVYGFKVIHLIPHNVFSINAGKWNDPYRGVLYIFINQALKGEPITVEGDGKQKRSISFAHDVLSFADKLLEADIENKSCFNIGPDTDESYISILELAQIIKNETKSSSPIIHVPRRPNEVKNAWCSSDKVRKTFGWESKVNLIDEIRKVVNFINDVGVKDFEYNIPIEVHRMSHPTWEKKRA